MQLKGSKTEENTKNAFVGEQTANRRCLFFSTTTDAARRSLGEDRRLVRDSGQGRALARQSFPEGAGHVGEVKPEAPKRASIVLLPLPPGEGWGEGVLQIPHPFLLPEGEGTTIFGCGA